MGKIIIKSVSDNGQRNGLTSIFEFVFQYQIQDVTQFQKAGADTTEKQTGGNAYSDEP